MTKVWLQLLAMQVEAKGNAAEVARELSLSPATVSLVLAGKYPAATAKIEKRVMAIYGHNGKVNCPVAGNIEPGRCATNWERAKMIGVKVSNPAKIRLYKTCLKCDLRNG